MSFHRQWARFRGMGRTTGPTPGVREAWHAGRRWWHVWLVHVDDARVRARRDEVAGAVAPWTTPFSADTPHVTVWVPGWEPGAEHPDRNERVELQIGPANGFDTCLFLEVRSPRLAALQRALGPDPTRTVVYRPHLTVARFEMSHPVGPVVEALRPYRRLPAIHTTGRLVRARLDAWSELGELHVDG